MQVDDDLIKSCISQNRKAQKELYNSLLPYLRSIANRYLRNTSYTKDVLQVSFILVFKNLTKFESSKGDFRKWAAKITINTSFNYNKRVIGIPQEELNIEQHDGYIDPQILAKLSNEYLLDILKQIPEGYFEVFNLAIIDGYSHKEIAIMLNISDTLSRKRLSRAKQFLQAKILSEPELKAQLFSLPSNLKVKR